MTGWTPNRVLYFGDHPYADLADLSLYLGKIFLRLKYKVSFLGLATLWSRGMGFSGFQDFFKMNVNVRKFATPGKAMQKMAEVIQLLGY